MAGGLVVHGVDFAGGEIRRKKWSDKELGKSVEGFRECFMPDFKLVIGVIGGRVGIG